ncbi:proton-coupled amino acid transporter-like protein pathetic [Manduca sexta]|uniref:Amino acid transporter transmembrane domain-containing protein n=1 Tax=Manduca sexta TaxID=7130 RepID=A0A922CWM2_MANSE|nr:proton-coupled amino acid transporter-like protein pathetic [Manduca sexta]KAG6462275.1 hypothetical protein O3G_MSEX013159 [Manduca sexta]
MTDDVSFESLRRTGISFQPDSHIPEVIANKYQVKATGEEARKYDFVTARPPARTTNVLESIGYLTKSCLGAGVVAIHESYKDCGLWTGLILNIVLGLAISYGMYTLAKSAQKIYGRLQIPALSYPDLAQATLEIGPWKSLKRFSKCFRYTVDFILIIEIAGCCCIYQIVVARAIKQLVEGLDTVTDSRVGTSPSIRVYIISLMIPCILLCMITNLKYLAPFSTVADFFIVIMAIATVYFAVKSANISPLEMSFFKSVPGVFEFIGVCGFSMDGVGVILTIENSMTEPKKLPTVLIGGMTLVMLLVTTVGFFGYWGFGENTTTPVTINFPWEPFPIIMKVFLALMIYITFGLNFWVACDVMWFYLKSRHEPKKHWLWERVYRAVLVVFITIVAAAFPNVTKFIGLIGSFCLSNLGFIYPAFIELSLDWEDPGPGVFYWRLWKFVVIFLWGLVLCIAGSYVNARELIIRVFHKKNES